MADYSIELLGPPAIKKDGKTTQIARKKSFGLAAYLADTERKAGREELAELFWPDVPLSKALGSLRTAIAELKTSLGNDFLITENKAITLSQTIYQCDVTTFRVLAIKAITVSDMEKAAALWNGSFMKGFYLKKCSQFSDWQFLEEQNLIRDYRNLLRKLSRKLINAGALQEAVSYSREGLRLDPYDEKIHRQIMYINARSGNKRAALEQFRLCRKKIEEDFELPLEEETILLANQIKKGVLDSKMAGEDEKSSAQLMALPRIAVLSFRHCGYHHQEEQSSIGNIIAEAIHGFFSKQSGIETISRTSSLSYKNTDKNLSRIAAELRADFIVEGYIEEKSTQTRIEAKLINTSKDSVIAVGNDIMEPQDNPLFTAAKISKTLLCKITTDKTEVLLVDSRGSANRESDHKDNYIKALKLQARHLLRNYDIKSCEHALRLYEESVSLHMEDAEAWAGVANAVLTKGFEGMFGADMVAVYKKADEAINRALSIDPLEPTALWIRGLISAERDFDNVSAERYYKKSLEINPDNPEALENYAILLLLRNKLDEASAIAERACEIDPVNRFTLGTKYWIYIAMRKYRMAKNVYKQVDKFFPDEIWAKYQNGFFFILIGNMEKAISIIEDVKDDLISLNRSSVLGMLSYAYAKVGRNGEAEKIIEIICRTRKSFYGYHIPISAAYLAMGNTEESLSWIEKAVTARDPGLMFLVATPFFKSLNNNPRYLQLLERINIVYRN
jgi:DNA-binding SARP family transcriptional activator